MQLPFFVFFCLCNIFFPAYWVIQSKKYFTDQQTGNTIQLFIALKENLSGLSFFWTSHSEGEFPRDYLINVVTYISRLPAVQTYFLQQRSPWCVIKCFYLKKCFIFDISRILCFSEIYRFRNLWCHHRHCYTMDLTFLLISFES